MADPLTITTAAIAFFGSASALASTIKKLHRVRHAAPAIQSLEDEMLTLRGYVQNVKDMLNTTSQAQYSILRQLPVETYLASARNRVSKVTTCLDQKLAPGSSERGVRKSAWLTWESDLKAMQKELCDVRVEIGACLTLMNAASAKRTEVQLDHLAWEGRMMQDDNIRALNSIQRSISEQRPAIALELELQLSTLQKTLQATIEGAASTSALRTPVMRSMSDFPTRRRLALCESPDQPVLQRRSSSGNTPMPGEHSDMDNIARDLSRTTLVSPGAPSPPRAQLRRDDGASTVISAIPFRRDSPCKGPCNCQCHRATKYKTPDILRHVVGQFLIDYSGLSMTTAPCNEYACAQRQKASVRIQYQLPLWSMIQGMVTIISQTSGAKGPEKVLRVSRIRPGLDEVFIQVQNGNIQRLKQLFNQGQGSPLDASDTGWTLLHYATVAKQMHVAKFLVDAGADPYAESARRESAFDVAWNRILSGSLDPDSEFILRQVFNNSAQLDRRQFTVLHKVVLGLVPRKLRRELEISTAQINEVDSTGYTPLAWACARGDTKAVELLLAYGASLEILNDTHELPIHLAAQTGTVDTIAVLVGASADVNTRVWQTEMTPLHFVAEYQDSAEMVEGLVNMGAEVHATDYMGWTPLHWASWRGHRSSLEGLLSQGADLDVRTLDGNSAVMLAVASNSHECLRGLISAGANCHVVRNSRWSLLHYAAMGGTVETLKALAKVDLGEIDVKHSRTADTKQTVLDMLEIRLQSMEHNDNADEYEDWRAAWSYLMEQVDSAPQAIAHLAAGSRHSEQKFVDADSSDDEEETFVDASDGQSPVEGEQEHPVLK